MRLIGLTADITTSFIANNKVEASALPSFISSVYNSLRLAENPTPEPEAVQKRKYTRRPKAEVETDASIVESEETSDDDQWDENDDQWDENGQPKQQARPEPMFAE